MGSGDGLARVTYLPGVKPPQEDALQDAAPAETVSRVAHDPAQGDREREPIDLPTMATVFGSRAVDDVDSVPDDSVPEDPIPTDSVLAEEPTPEPEPRQTARAERVSMNALTRRGMSRWELENTLRARDLDEETVGSELERLEGVGLIDDAALAETIVRTQHERKGLGRSALTAELRRRHIDQQHIDEALLQVDDDDEQSRATELALKRAPQLHSFDQETAKRRLSGFLMRKGYSGSVVRAAVDEALAGRSGKGSSGGVRFR
jgi:regulatory protein